MISLETLKLIKHAMDFDIKYTPKDCIALGYGMHKREDPITPYGIEMYIEEGDVKIFTCKNDNRYRIHFVLGDTYQASISYPFPQGMAGRK